MRVVGLDLGARRVGVAVSDSAGVLALPHATVERTRDLPRDRRRLVELVRELDAELVVVGLPLSLSGDHGPAAQRALEEVEALAEQLDVPVETHDERLTTVAAERSLGEMGVRGPARRSVVDQVAAAVMLQGWLDGPAGRRAHEGAHRPDVTEEAT